MVFEQIVEMLNAGIMSVVNKTPRFPFGFRGGNYLGCPGKDIYFILSDLSDEQFCCVAKKLASLYPQKPPNNHVKWAACIRYVYGCFEKQGCLRSKRDKERMVEENLDWTLPVQFMDEVSKYFKRFDNKYGLVLHYEMLAHRWGDRAIIEKNKFHLETMLGLYHKSQAMGRGIKSWKHTFTPFFWAAGYLASMKDSKAVNYYKLNLKMMSKYCPDAREGYREKAKTSLQYIKAHSNTDEWNEFYVKHKKRKNKCLRKVRI